MKWVDKEKGLAYLSFASQPVQQVRDKQVLNTAAKIVENFENPSTDEEKSSEMAEKESLRHDLGEAREIFAQAQQARDEEETRFSLRNNNQGSGWSREAMQQAWDRAMSRAEPEAFVKEYLLPPFDEYLIGYKSRELSLSPEHTHNAHTNNDIFFPIIAHDGIICGNWTPWEKNLNTSFLLSQSEELTFDKQWKAFCQLNKRWNAKCLST